MIDFHAVVENLRDSLSEHSPKTIVFCAIGIFMVFLGIISFGMVKKVVEEKKKPEEENFILDQKLLLPKGPEVPDEYALSRVTKDKWSSEEAEKWWTVPDENDVQELGEANDRIVNGIIGVAP